jgi:hypothetical protein
MVAGIFAITFGAVALVIGPRWAGNMANKLRQQLGSEIDPTFFKLGPMVLGLAAIVFGIVEVTRALR